VSHFEQMPSPELSTLAEMGLWELFQLYYEPMDGSHETEPQRVVIVCESEVEERKLE